LLFFFTSLIEVRRLDQRHQQTLQSIPIILQIGL
jgi:hypothetical protein